MDMKSNSISSSLLTPIRDCLDQARQHIQQSVNHVMVETYWTIGKLIVEHEQHGQYRAEYGKQQLEQLSAILTTDYGKGFDPRNLRNMRLFYRAFPIWNAVRTELSWTHYRRLIRIENTTARDWYMNEAIDHSWSARALDRQVNKLYYERLLSSQKKDAVIKEANQKTDALAVSPKQVLRDPYILDFLNLPHQDVVETDLEKRLIQNLHHFLLELGKGFAFVERQQRIQTEDQDFYIDLVFYNFKLKCFLLIDLKIGKLSHQDVGQMDTYVRIYDQHKKDASDNPTIGLILCSEKSEAVAKYSVLTDSEQLFASKYVAYLPTEDELVKQLQEQRALVSNSE